jgi:hypothetical protein
VYLKGRQRGAHKAEEVVFVANGAKSIWNLVEEHFLDAVQIADWCHAAEHIWEVAHTVYSEASDAAREWAEALPDVLREGDLKHVLQALRTQLNADLEEDPAQQEITYFQNNQHRLRYPEFRSQGYQIGSETIESFCKRVIGARLKQAGSQPGQRHPKAGQGLGSHHAHGHSADRGYQQGAQRGRQEQSAGHVRRPPTHLSLESGHDFHTYEGDHQQRQHLFPIGARHRVVVQVDLRNGQQGESREDDHQQDDGLALPPSLGAQSIVGS